MCKTDWYADAYMLFYSATGLPLLHIHQARRDPPGHREISQWAPASCVRCGPNQNNGSYLPILGPNE